MRLTFMPVTLFVTLWHHCLVNNYIMQKSIERMLNLSVSHKCEKRPLAEYMESGIIAFTVQYICALGFGTSCTRTVQSHEQPDWILLAAH